MSTQDRFFLPTLGVFRPLFRETVNQILRMDSQIIKRLAPLEGKLIAVEITALPRFFLQVTNSEVQVLWETNEHPDGTIRTTLFVGVPAKTSKNGHRFHDDSTWNILGDPDTKRAVRKFFSTFEPDWEECVARYIGDAMARKAGQCVDVAAEWAKNGRHSAMQNFSEYLQEERQVLPTRLRAARYLGEVARLELAVDALEMRLALLDCLAE
jgi:ubiquinone biosynthesis protein UbiJ